MSATDALVEGLVSATDALVEGLVPQAHDILIELHVRQMMDKAADQHPQAAAQLVEMDNALAEVSQLRHVVAHRAGRVDVRAHMAAPSLCYIEDELVRIG